MPLVICTANGWLEDQDQQFFNNEIQALQKRGTKSCASISLHGWGDTQWPINPPLLSSSHSPSFFPPTSSQNGVRSHSRCGTESWTELELVFNLTV